MSQDVITISSSPYYHVLSRWSSPNIFDLDTDKSLYIFHICPRVLGEIVVRFGSRAGLLPSWKCCIHDLRTGQLIQVCREGVEYLAIYLVGCGYFYRAKVVENVEFGQVESGVVVDGGAIFHDNKIKPPASLQSY